MEEPFFVNRLMKHADYEANKRNIEKINFDEYYFVKNEQELVGKNGGELIIIPAVATDRNSAQSYISKLSKANLKYGFGKDYLPDFFLKEMETKLKPDLIFIDTRTGINDIGGLVFNRYAQSIFLFFYGNQQNMFGLESILPELIELKEKNVEFYLVNSPVPKNPTDERTEVDNFVQRSYKLFCENFYLKNDYLPSPFDESAEHFPINIHYNEQALILNNYKKLGSLIESSDNEYRNIANIILSEIEEKTDDKDFINTSSSNEEVLECIVNIDKGAGTSEVEFQKEKDLTKYFYPRKVYKYIFDEKKLLILGEKGVGKTALFSVLSHKNYVNALADFCGVDTNEIKDTKWVIGFDKDKPEFPSRENFESLSGFTSFEFRNYWVILLFRQLGEDSIEDSPLKIEIFKSKIRGIKELAKRENIGEELLEILADVNSALKRKGDKLIIVYDHLDAVLSNENELRGKLVSALLTFYYDNFNRISNIKAKIFLRQDIFDREVTYITDKVKIQNYSVGITWNYNQLLNIIWKRLYEQNKDLSIFDGVEFDQHDLLGAIPNLQDEKEHKPILEKIFGKRMGGNNKAYPYNWVRLRTEDTNNRIHPRTLIKLFSGSAKLELTKNDLPKDRIIRSKNIEIALRDTVSKHQIQELSEEYPELREVFDNLSEKVGGRSPIKEPDLTKALKDLGIKEPLTTITRLKDIGLLKDYKPYKNKNSDDDRRYHIPDLYLFGLNFTRKGAK